MFATLNCEFVSIQSKDSFLLCENTWFKAHSHWTIFPDVKHAIFSLARMDTTVVFLKVLFTMSDFAASFQEKLLGKWVLEKTSRKLQKIANQQKFSLAGEIAQEERVIRKVDEICTK